MSCSVNLRNGKRYKATVVPVSRQYALKGYGDSGGISSHILNAGIRGWVDSFMLYWLSYPSTIYKATLFSKEKFNMG